MIKDFVQRWEERKGDVRALFEEKHPEDYKEVVANVIKVLSAWSNYDVPDPERIHEIDDGHYQGMLVYVIAEKGYQPSTYWYVRVGYGSCSGCDTLESIRGYRDEKPSKGQVDRYMTLALHIVQGLKEMGGEAA